MLDTLKATNDLLNAGMSAKQSKVIVDLLKSRFDQSDLATKSDIKVLKSDINVLKSDIDHLRSEMDIKFENLEGKMDIKFENLEEKMDLKFGNHEKRFDSLEDKMDIKFRYSYAAICLSIVATGAAVKIFPL